MDPGLAPCELLYEHGAYDRRRLTIFGVLEIGDLAAHQDPIFGVDQQAPYPIAGILGGLAHEAPEGIVVADGGSARVAHRDDGSAGEGGEVEKVRGAVPNRARQSIREHEAAFRVRVD